MARKSNEDIRKELDELNEKMRKKQNQNDKVIIALTESSEKRLKRFNDIDVKHKKSQSLKKSWADPSVYNKRKLINKQSRTNEVKTKISEGLKGIVRGKPSDAHKHKLSRALKGVPKPKLICPYCSKEGAGPVMKRYHFENCKHK